MSVPPKQPSRAKRFTRDTFDTSGLSSFDAGEQVVAKSIHSIVSPIAGIIGHAVRPFSRKPKPTPKPERPNLYSTMSGQDTTDPRNQTGSDKFDRIMGGGQGSVYGAGCVSRYLTMGGRPADVKNIKKAKRFCGIN
tara:strand:- start:111 stop:518 length:408 start_codon:yes stop_codon:yes gene_type:complete